MALAALGVVYGDIGTSPLCPPGMPAGCHGEILDVRHASRQSRGRRHFGVDGLGATPSGRVCVSHTDRSCDRTRLTRGFVGLLHHTGISVLSAVEGIEVETIAYQPYTLPIAITVLVALFAIQPHGTALWRERLFIFLSRNSQRASSFFHIPAEQVVEIGVVVEI